MPRKVILCVLLICLMVSFGAVCIGGLEIYMNQHRRTLYPGEGVYDLTSYYPYTVNGEMKDSGTEMLPISFSTDSTKINVLNELNDIATVYLFDVTGEEYNIGVFTLAKNECKAFTNLSSARTYCVGVESAGRKYELSISD